MNCVTFWLLMAMLLPWCASSLQAASTGTVSGVPVPFVWPVSKTIAGQKIMIVSKFGHRQAPDTHLDEPHDGVDFAVPEEAAIRASRSGKVIFVGLSSAYAGRKDKKEKNRLVIIRHDDGLTTRYVHIEHLHVQPGKQVAAGDILGTVADSDEWPGTVVHFEIRDPNGRALDPQPLFAEPPKTAAR